jgi:uncharacterized membrane protein
MQNRRLRLISVALGAWVVISSVFWRQSTGQFANILATGLVVVVSALLAIRTPNLRFVGTAAGIWLVASLFAFPAYSSPAIWGNVVAGAAIALVSLVGPEEADMITS